MKIALCFSGEPRCWEYGYKNIQHLKDIHSDIDINVFIHTWDNITYKEGGFFDKRHTYRSLQTDWNNPHSNIAPTICYDSFIKTYNPVLYKIENKNVLDNIITRKKLTQLEDYIKFTGFTNISQLYSAGAVHKLRMEYEKNHGFTYDIVLQIRTDLLLNPDKLSIKVSSLKCLASDVVRFHKVLIKSDGKPGQISCVKIDHNVWGANGKTMNKIFSNWDITQLCSVNKKDSNTPGIHPWEYACAKSEVTISTHIINCGCIISCPLIKDSDNALTYKLKTLDTQGARQSYIVNN